MIFCEADVKQCPELFHYLDGLMQDWGISIANAPGGVKSCVFHEVTFITSPKFALQAGV